MAARQNVEVNNCWGVFRTGIMGICRDLETLRLVEGPTTIEDAIKRNIM